MRSLTTWVMVILTLLGFLAITVLMDVPSAMALLPLLFAAAGVLWIWRLARVMERRQARQLQAQQVAAAVAAERLTIARDLHDLVSHGLGLITVRAAVARSVDATSPDRLMAALGDMSRPAGPPPWSCAGCSRSCAPASHRRCHQLRERQTGRRASQPPNGQG